MTNTSDAPSHRGADGIVAGHAAVVTGAGRGNGKAIAQGLARAGALVFVADIDMKSAHETALDIEREGGRAVAVRWNIADPSEATPAAEAIHRHVEKISILVNNAGIEGGGLLGEDAYPQNFERVIDVNLTGTMRVTQTLIPDLVRTRGSIINITSLMASVAYQPGASAYSAAKAALTQWTRALATDLAPHGVRVNAIAPGFFETAMTAGTRSDPQRMHYFASRTPMRRMGQPEELVGPVLFLASDLASYVTGAVLPVDGGLTSN